MDIINFFANKLKTSKESLQSAEQKWDRRAKSFYKNQVTRRDYFPGAVTEILENKGILHKEATVLDICSGSGRYALPFSKKCRSVTALDLSTEMLHYLEKEIVENNIENIDTIKAPWPTTKYNNKVDLAFAAMCPATRSLEALRAMSNIAEQYCVICQFIYSSDNIVELLKETALLDKDQVKDPHNNRSSVQAYFNILWELGYDPEINYLEDVEETELSLADIVASYVGRYDNLNEVDVEKVVKSVVVDNKVKVIKRSKIGIISWKTASKR